MQTLDTIWLIMVSLGLLAGLIMLVQKAMGVEDPTRLGGRRPQPKQSPPSAAPAGACPVCKYVNASGASRCYQCGNTLA
jgi:hypothetical protein